MLAMCKAENRFKCWTGSKLARTGPEKSKGIRTAFIDGFAKMLLDL